MKAKKRYVIPPLDPQDYSDGSDLLEECPALVHEYVRLRVMNVPGPVALGRAFGHLQVLDGRAGQRVAILEASRTFGMLFERAIYGDGLHDGTGWTERLAAWSLREIAADTGERGPARVSAMKELNIMHAITLVDDAGNTRSGRSLEEFYRLEGKPKGHKENPHSLPPDIETPLQEADPTPPDAAMPQAPDPIPPAHQQFIADVLEPVKPRPVTQTRQLVPFERLKVVQR